MTAAHLAVKAVGISLNEMRHMQGVLLADRLYRTPGGPVDVSVAESSGAGDHEGVLLHTVHDVAAPSGSGETSAFSGSGDISSFLSS